MLTFSPSGPRTVVAVARRSLLAGTIAAFGLRAWAAPDVDSGRVAPALVVTMVEEEMPDGWVRIRGAELGRVDETRAAMEKFRARGMKICVMLRGPGNTRGNYLPEDLVEAHKRYRALGKAFGDLVDAWEIDNEPDLAFVPENAERYAAFLKTAWLGLRAGERDEESGTSGQFEGGSTLSPPQARRQGRGPGLVLVGALGLPPGPWLERFVENDGLSYTDGFNYHYYGYAEDFTAAYKQHEAAVKELSVNGYSLLRISDRGGPPNNQQPITNSPRSHSLPVFLTEIGYGMLGKEAAGTKEGRLRQWKWFKSVGNQATALQIEAPMAFLLVPYLEYGMYEYGLTVPAAEPPEFPVDGSRLKRAKRWTAGGVDYRPWDFGVEEAEPWMELIGTKIGENEVTPALAWWLGGRGAPSRNQAKSAEREARGEERRAPSGKREASSPASESTLSQTQARLHAERRRSEGRSWTVKVAEPSPVVIDFLTGEGLMPLKRFGGNFVTGVVSRTPSPDRMAPDRVLPPMIKPPVEGKPPRSEDFIVQVRTQNGNLFEVYPVRTATPQWQTYLEHRENFTMAFYGRAELPWRFRENTPLSLVLTLYPTEYPAVYEFRRAELVTIGAKREAESVQQKFRYGSGEIVLYNFSEKAVRGRLTVPEWFTTDAGGSTLSQTQARLLDDGGKLETMGLETHATTITLQPMERMVVPVEVGVPGESFARFKTRITFEPEDPAVPPARFVTEFFPALEGMERVVRATLAKREEQSAQRADSPEAVRDGVGGSNAERIRNLKLASEEAPRRQLANGWFVQDGAEVTESAEGFLVTVTGAPAGKVQRVEVEFPWPEGKGFEKDGFLNVEFRLKE